MSIFNNLQQTEFELFGFIINLFDLMVDALIILGILQLITITLIVIDYKRRSKRKIKGGFKTISLAPVTIDGNKIQIYMEGKSLYKQMVADINKAKKSIYLETFIWSNDKYGQKILDTLYKKAKQGVKVFIVIDVVGNGGLGKGLKINEDPKIPNLKVLKYKGIKKWYHVILPSRYNVTHRKLLIVDKKIGYVGGYNIGKSFMFEWRDTHVKVIGPAVSHLSYAFVDLWNDHGKNLPTLPYPKTIRSNVFRVDRNDPSRKNYPIRSNYLDAIELASKSIKITNAYFIPDPSLRKALFTAAERGVDIEILTPWESNHIIADWVARQRYSQYLKRGIKIFGYNGAMIHSKTVTIDGIWSLVGTANLDKMSMSINLEVNIEFFSSEFAKRMEQVFECDKQNSRKIDFERWQRRNWKMRLGELILAPLWPFF